MCSEQGVTYVSESSVLFNQAVYPSGPQIAVKVSSDNPAVVPNGDLLIDPAADFEAFKFPTNPVSQNTLVNLTFQAAGKAIKLPLLVTQASSSTPDLLPPTFDPQIIGGGADGATCTVHFAANLPASGAMVFLRSSDPARLRVPLTVFVPGGASSLTFKIQTSPVSAPIVKSVVAAYGSTIRTGFLTIVPAALFSITPSSPSLLGGNMGNATVRFNASSPCRNQST